MTLDVLLSAGEVSGDVVAALLARSLRAHDPSVSVWGAGGERMAEAGVEIVSATNHLGRVGVTETLSVIAPLWKTFRSIRRRVLVRKPDVAVLIANDVFNVILGRWLRRRGVRTIAYFPPQIWIWRSLLWLFRGSYDTVLASFPAENDIYRTHVRDTRFVGHYLCDLLQPAGEEARHAIRLRFGFGPEDKVVAVLPGSRSHELERIAPILLDAVARIAAEETSVRFLMPLAEKEHAIVMASLLRARLLTERVVIVHDSHSALRAADLVLATSGTATLEAALIGAPMIVAYRLSRATVAFVRLCIRMGLMDSETLALPNLITGRNVVPELRQEMLSATALADAALQLLGNRDSLEVMRSDLALVRSSLETGNAIGRVVADIAGQPADFESAMLLEAIASGRGVA